MNHKMILYILRYVLCIESAILLLPFAVSLVYSEASASVLAFAITALVCFTFAFPFTLKKPRDTELSVRDGLVAVALSWILISIMGSVPFIISGYITSPVDALFETVSGFTTTGASILKDVEILPNSILFWRAFTHWIGGMGVLVFLLIILPSGNHMNLMKAESPGPSVDKLVPKVRATAKILYGIYVVMTLLQIAILTFTDMTFFEAVLTSFSTAGTGGYGFLNSSMADFSAAAQIIVTVFMILFGVNFGAYYLILAKRFRKAFTHVEVLTYLGIIAAAITVITVDIAGKFDYTASVGDAIRHSAFQVGSIMTTTGFSSCDFNLWPTLSKTVLVMLMFVGACAGSTGGGIKVSRVMILIKSIGKELNSYIHPNSVKTLKLDKKPVEHEVVRGANVFIAVYVCIFAGSVLLISLDGFDLVTNFTAVAATFNNIGPGLELVGPAANYSGFSNLSKLVMCFCMLAGRLELFPILMLFNKNTWKKF